MPQLVFETQIQASPQDLWDFHSQVTALPLLAPPGSRIAIVGEDLEVRNGAVHRLRIKRMGGVIRWEAHISEVIPGRQFRDTAAKSPFAAWTHLHEFLPFGTGAMLRDTVDYTPPFGPLGGLIDRLLLRKDIEAMFRHRHRVTKERLEAAVKS
jgi:ligand-binding SRPBCC domain-containing protein